LIKPDRPPVEFEHVFAPEPRVALQASNTFEQPGQVELHNPVNVQSGWQVGGMHWPFWHVPIPQLVHVVMHDAAHDVPQVPPLHEKLHGAVSVSLQALFPLQ